MMTVYERICYAAFIHFCVAYTVPAVSLVELRHTRWWGYWRHTSYRSACIPSTTHPALPISSTTHTSTTNLSEKVSGGERFISP